MMPGNRRSIGVAVALGVLGTPVVANAFECGTETERDAEQIVVAWPMKGDAAATSPAVRLEPGETLCLVGRRDDSGNVVDLKLVATPTGQEDVVIRVRLERHDSLQLEVSHSTREVLHYATALEPPRGARARATRREPVAPSQTSRVVWAPLVERLLLTDWRLEPAPEVLLYRAGLKPERPYPPANGRVVSATLGGSVGERYTRLHRFDSALQRDGFTALTDVRTVRGMDLDFEFGALRLGLEVSGGGAKAVHRTEDRHVETRLTAVGLRLGTDLYRHRAASFFATSGVLGGSLAVDATGFPTLEAQLTPSERDVAFRHTLVPFDLGCELLLPLAPSSPNGYYALKFGARAGWLQQVRGRWRVNEQDNDREIDGPNLDASGFRYGLFLGFGAYGRRDPAVAGADPDRGRR